MADLLSGSCLCGAVRYTCLAQPAATVVCHCLDCKKHTGSAYATAMFLLKTELEVTGELQTFDKETDSGSIMTRSFCGTCGGHISEWTTAYPEHIVVHAGTLDDPTQVSPDSQCWTPRTLHWINDVGALKGFEKDPEF